jgi:hypothetical protein
MSDAASPWMTLKAAAAYVHRGPRFLRKEIAAGRLRAATIGGRGEVLTRRDWLDVWVESLARPVDFATRRRA